MPAFITRTIVRPRPTTAERLLALPAQVQVGYQAYRRTPAILRRPEPAARLGITVAATWFSVLFLALGLSADRSGSAGASVVLGFGAAALLGPVGAAVFLTRRHRLGLALVAAMLVLGQAVALAAVL